MTCGGNDEEEIGNKNINEGGIYLGKIFTRLPFPCELLSVHVHEFTGASPDMEFSKQKYQPLYKFLQ